MHLSLLTLLPIAAASALLDSSLSPQHIFSNPSPAEAVRSDLKIPTIHESAVLARRILNLTPLGTLSTVFPTPHSTDDEILEQRPAGLGGVPIGLMDYIADCDDSGNPTILAINIATSFKNVAAGSNISLSLQWTPPYPPKSRIEFSKEAVPYSAANLPRFALLGTLEKIPEDEVQAKDIGACFVEKHRDAKYWLPGNKIHASEWVRLVVREVYWVGGFGDRAYIGWIPVQEWGNVTRAEWEGVKLPGEKKGWKEWAVDTFDFGQWEL